MGIVPRKRKTVNLPIGPAAFDFSVPRMDFDLLEACELRREAAEKEREESEGRKPEDGHTTLYDAPEWMLSEVKRQVLKSPYSEQEAMAACIDAGRAHCEEMEDQHLWIQLSEACRSTEQKYPDSEDFDDINVLCDHFTFTVDDNHGGRRTRNLRCPKETLGQLSALAPKMGNKVLTLAQVFIIDGLRSQPDTVHGELMDVIVVTYCRKLRKRVRKLAALLRSFEIPLSDEVEIVLAEIKL